MVSYVGYNYEYLMVKHGFTDPKEHRKKKAADMNPLPMELRDEYVRSCSFRSTKSRKNRERPEMALENLQLLN